MRFLLLSAIAVAAITSSAIVEPTLAHGRRAARTRGKPSELARDRRAGPKPVAKVFPPRARGVLEAPARPGSALASHQQIVAGMHRQADIRMAVLTEEIATTIAVLKQRGRPTGPFRNRARFLVRALANAGAERLAWYQERAQSVLGSPASDPDQKIALESLRRELGPTKGFDAALGEIMEAAR